MFKGFRDFIFRGNVIDLAVAVVIGAAFGKIVDALVKDFITPLIGAFGGQPDFSALKITINKSNFLIGDFFNNLISFIIIAAVIYFFVIVPMNHLLSKVKKGNTVDTPEKSCPDCLSSIPIAARVCRFCGYREK